MNPNTRGPPEPQAELRPLTMLITYTINNPKEVKTMITPEYSKRYNCPVCGWRSCPGCDEPLEFDDPYGSSYGDEPEALGWPPASAEDHYPVPKDDAVQHSTSR